MTRIHFFFYNVTFKHFIIIHSSLSLNKVGLENGHFVLIHLFEFIVLIDILSPTSVLVSLRMNFKSKPSVLCHSTSKCDSLREYKHYI